ncbi:MAG: hypothetical protein K2L31_10965 [Muribaculum sp.]|nr:hypothetical protein [Muribaculum sp.]
MGSISLKSAVEGYACHGRTFGAARGYHHLAHSGQNPQVIVISPSGICRHMDISLIIKVTVRKKWKLGSYGRK